MWVPLCPRCGSPSITWPASEVRRRRGFSGRSASKTKYIPEKDIQPWHLATEAARSALSAAEVEPLDVDLALTVGLPRGDYRTWALSLAVQKALGHEPGGGARPG